MEHRFMRLYKDGVWTGKPDRSITVKGVQHNLDEYAEQHGIELPDSKSKPSKKSKTQVNSNADMEHKDSSGDTGEHEHGTSQSTE
jgi:hypothetical protein